MNDEAPLQRAESTGDVTASGCVTLFIQRGPVAAIQQGPAFRKAVAEGFADEVVEGIAKSLRAEDSRTRENAAESIANLAQNADARALLAKIALPTLASLILERDNKHRFCFRFATVCVVNLAQDKAVSSMVVDNTDMMEALFILAHAKQSSVWRNAVRAISLLASQHSIVASMVVERGDTPLLLNLAGCEQFDFRFAALQGLAGVAGVKGGDLALIKEEAVVPSLCRRMFDADILPMEKDTVARALVNAFKDGHNPVAKCIESAVRQLDTPKGRCTQNMAKILSLARPDGNDSPLVS